MAHIDYEDGRMSQWWMWQCWLDHQWHCGTAPDGLHSPPPLDWQLVLPEGFTPPEEPTDEEMAAHRAKIDRLIEEGWEGEPPARLVMADPLGVRLDAQEDGNQGFLYRLGCNQTLAGYMPQE